ncbi:hypothetical protein QQ054_11155 [Oscillatoria amoena NRMC-F 0135]|nr:hypothetical protein [Oscillatoria amoena NRMC-F 0135]
MHRALFILLWGLILASPASANPLGENEGEFMRQAKLLAQRGDYETALKAFNKLYDLNPKNTMARLEARRLQALKDKNPESFFSHRQIARGHPAGIQDERGPIHGGPEISPRCAGQCPGRCGESGSDQYDRAGHHSGAAPGDLQSPEYLLVGRFFIGSAGGNAGLSIA